MLTPVAWILLLAIIASVCLTNALWLAPGYYRTVLLAAGGTAAFLLIMIVACESD